MIGLRRAQDLLGGACQRAGRRHRLVDLVRERGRHAAHQVEARGLRGLRLLGPQPRLDLPHRRRSACWRSVTTTPTVRPVAVRTSMSDLEFGERRRRRSRAGAAGRPGRAA